MVRIAVTGHMNLSEPTIPLIDQAIRHHLAAAHSSGELVGVSCIAAGADSIFAAAVLDLGGELEAVIPSTDYRQAKVNADHATVFDDLVRRASNVITMPYEHADRDAYHAANEALLATCDQLIAVWDGQAPADKGGTAQVVAEAKNRGIPVTIIWPEGAERT